jgi:carboxymethylenebutenolidase
MNIAGTGFATAVQPIQAQTVVHTDSAGLEVGDVRIPVGADGGALAAYFARPQGAASLPVVVLVHEIWSVHEHFRDLCRRLAKAGYLAIAPDLFARQGDVAGKDIEAIRAIVARVPDAQVMADIDATVSWAGANGGDLARLGVTGFCWGGRITWLHAAHDPRVKAAVAWYGTLVKPATELQPRHPVDVAAELRAPVLGLYGGADAGIPNDTVERMRAALAAAGQPSQIVVYPDMPHAFYADYRPSYRPEAARDGWQRMLDWFRRHGVA